MFEWLPEAIRNLEASPIAREKGWRFILNPPATDDAIRQAEASLSLTFPPDLRAFLRRWNGVELFRVDLRTANDEVSAGSEILIRSAAEIVGLNQNYRSILDPADAAAWDRLIMFADTPIMSANFCALSPIRVTPEGDYAVVDCHEDYGPRCWRRCVIAPSIGPWLHRVFDEATRNGDPYYWLNSPEVRAILLACDRELQEELATRKPSPTPGPGSPAVSPPPTPQARSHEAFRIVRDEESEP